MKIQEEFNYLMENYTPVNVIHYFDNLESQPFENILENQKMIYTEPTKGPKFLKECFEKNFLSVPPDVIKESVEEMKQYYIKARDEGYENTEHLEILSESIRQLESMYLDYKDNEVQYLQESILEVLEYQRDSIDLSIMENYYSMDIEDDVLMENVMIRGASNLGVAIRRPLTSNKEEAIKRYLVRMEKDLSTLKEKQKKYKTKSKIKKFAQNVFTDDNIYNLTKRINETKKAIEYQKGKLKELQSVKENIGTMAPDIIYAEEGTSVNNRLLKKKTELDFAIGFTKIFMNPSEDINLESFNAMLQSAYHYDRIMDGDILTEGVINDKAKKVALGADKAARKVTAKLRTASRETRRVKTIAKKVPGHFDNLIDSTFGAIKRMDKEERRKRIIEGNFRTKLMKIIRNGILVGIGWAINPAVAAVTLITTVAVDKHADYKVRRQLVADLEQELRMVKEKIKDAESKQDNKKKYQLMRLENALERDIQRVQYSLKDYRATGKGVK